MKMIIAILVGKICIIVGKLFKRGTVMAGKFALKIDKKIMYKLVLPKTIIAVTGSSGKGSTTKIIADCYRNDGYTVVHNLNGANVLTGVLTTLIEKCTITGKIKKDVLILETDERWAKYIFPAIKPNYVVITNITRDQPPRQGNFDIVFNDIMRAIDPSIHLILNADDPYLQKFVNGKNKVTYYGIKKNRYSTKNNRFENLNLVYCPKCNNKLEYEFYHFENIGNYYCPKCDFKRPNPEYEITNIDYINKTITINNDCTLKIPFSMLFAAYNTIAAYTVLSLNKLDKNKIIENINNSDSNHNHFECFSQKNRLVYTLNNKNENSTTFNQSIIFIDRDKNPKTIVIGWKEISRRYNFDDISWLYDINFELLKKHNIEKVVCVGVQQFDIATRIKLSDIDEDKIVCFENLEDATKYLKMKTKESIYAVLNFDYVKPFNNLMREEKR